MIKKVFCLLLCFFIAFILDTALLPRLLPYTLKPIAMLALVLALSASFSLWTAGVAAALGGLMEDLLCSEAIGLSAALFLIAAVGLTSILHKNTFKKGILYLIMTGLAFAVEGMEAFFFRLYGATFDFWYSFFFTGLCRSFVTAACALLLISLFTQLNKGRIERT